MAATRLIAMHQNKGRSLQRCLKDRTDYAQNGEKTEGGELVTSYACDPKTVEEEFAVSKRDYAQMTGRRYAGDIIAYQIRQSFKPGEITPEEANRIGYETAMRWTKGGSRSTKKSLSIKRWSRQLMPIGSARKLEMGRSH